MFIAYLIVTVVTAAANVFSATLDFIRYKQISINMARVGVPESWMPLLGILKGAAAVGLLVGIGVPFVGAGDAYLNEMGDYHPPVPQAQLAIAIAECPCKLRFQPRKTLDFLLHIRQLALEHGLHVRTSVMRLP